MHVHVLHEDLDSLQNYVLALVFVHRLHTSSTDAAADPMWQETDGTFAERINGTNKARHGKSPFNRDSPHISELLNNLGDIQCGGRGTAEVARRQPF